MAESISQVCSVYASAGETPGVLPLAERVVMGLAEQIGALQVLLAALELAALEKELLAWLRSSELSQPGNDPWLRPNLDNRARRLG